MTKGELITLLADMPDDHDVRIVGLEGPHAAIARVVSQPEDGRVAILIELQFREATDPWESHLERLVRRCDVRIEGVPR